MKYQRYDKKCIEKALFFLWHKNKDMHILKVDA